MSFYAYLFPRRWLPPLFDSHVLSVAFSEQWQHTKKPTQAGNGFVLFSFSAFTIPPNAFHSHGSSTATVRGRGKLVVRVELVDVLLFLAARTKPQKWNPHLPGREERVSPFAFAVHRLTGWSWLSVCSGKHGAGAVLPSLSQVPLTPGFAVFTALVGDSGTEAVVLKCALLPRSQRFLRDSSLTAWQIESNDSNQCRWGLD